MKDVERAIGYIATWVVTLKKMTLLIAVIIGSIHGPKCFYWLRDPRLVLAVQNIYYQILSLLLENGNNSNVNINNDNINNNSDNGNNNNNNTNQQRMAQIQEQSS